MQWILEPDDECCLAGRPVILRESHGNFIGTDNVQTLTAGAMLVHDSFGHGCQRELVS